MNIMKHIPDLTWRVVKDALGDEVKNPETSCLYYAAAAAGALKGTGWRFTAGASFTPNSQVCGWGIAVSPRDKTYYLTTDGEIEEDGGYVGHCWTQIGKGPFAVILDAMTGYVGPRHDAETLVVYHAIPRLTRGIQKHHTLNLKRVAQAARKNKDFVEVITQASNQGKET